MKVSVVVLSWNRRDDIVETLAALREQDYPDVEVIVVDNGSEDGTPELVERDFPEVRLIRLPRNIGITGRNNGIADAQGEVIVFIDDDMVIGRDWISKAVMRFEAEPKAGLLSAKIVNFYDKQICDWVHPKDAAVYADTEFESISFCCGASAVRKALLDEVGLFAEELFIYHEEEDLAIRIIDAGYRVLYCPELVAYHKIPPGEPYRWGEKRMYYTTRNRIWYCWKYYPLRVAFLATVLKVPRDVKYLVKKRYVRAYFRGFFDALRGLPGIMKKRRPVSRETLRKVSSPWLRLMLRF